MKKGLLGVILGGLLFCLPAYGQGYRFDSQVQQRGTVAGVTNVVILPNSPIISFCNHPANAVPCTNKATTFTDITLGTPCLTSTQIVLAGTTSCVGSPDAEDNWGVWVPTGTYDYTVTVAGNNFGPYIVTALLPTGFPLATNNTWLGNNAWTVVGNFYAGINAYGAGVGVPAVFANPISGSLTAGAIEIEDMAGPGSPWDIGELSAFGDLDFYNAASLSTWSLHATGTHKGLLSHANTANRTWSLPDDSGSVDLTHGSDDHTGLITSRGPIAMLTGGVGTGGHYTLCYAEEVTTADGSGSTITFSASFISHTIARTFTGSAVAVAATANSERGCIPMNVDDSTNITYAVTASAPFATADYAVDVWLKRE